MRNCNVTFFFVSSIFFITSRWFVNVIPEMMVNKTYNNEEDIFSSIKVYELLFYINIFIFI